MLRPTPTGRVKGQRPRTDDGNSASSELKFVADLGRSLLVTVHPKKVASRVAEAVRVGSGAMVSAFVAELKNIGLVSCAFDINGEVEADFLNRKSFERWLDFLPPQIGHGIEDTDDLFLSGTDNKFEYISPLHINGEIKGAVVTGFASRSDF